MYMAECPKCNKSSLFYDESRNIYECVKCERTWSNEETLINDVHGSQILHQCPACRRLTAFNNPRTHKIVCLYLPCKKEFTPEEALIEDANFRVHLAQEPNPKLKPKTDWEPNDIFDK